MTRELHKVRDELMDREAQLAARLGIGERYLRKLFQRELGVSPTALARWVFRASGSSSSTSPAPVSAAIRWNAFSAECRLPDS